MSKRVLKEKTLTVPEVKEVLETIGEENLDQFQRRAYDYSSKFAKTQPSDAQELLENLVSRFELDGEEAVQIVNCMPESIGEIRVFLAGGRRIVKTEKLVGILKLLDEHRKKE